MHLESIEILGFRGINRLSLALDENNMLIGENAWGNQACWTRSHCCWHRRCHFIILICRIFTSLQGMKIVGRSIFRLFSPFVKPHLATIYRHATVRLTLFGWKVRPRYIAFLSVGR